MSRRIAVNRKLFKMNNAVQLKKKTSFIASVLELRKLIVHYLFNHPSHKEEANEIKPRFLRFEPLQELKPHRRRFIPASYYHRLTMHGKIDLAQRVYSLIEAYPETFVSPVPDMNAFKSAIDELSDAYYNYMLGERTRDLRVRMMEKENEFVALFKEVISYVEIVTNGKTEVYRKTIIGH